MEDVWEDQGSQREDGLDLEDLVVQDTLLAVQGQLVGKTSENSNHE